MAKFVNTLKAVAAIDEIITEADNTLTLVSPYLKLSNDFKEKLELRNKENKVTTIIFGKQELNPKEMIFLQSLQFVSLRYKQNLHAKCYFNENQMIITSLNFYEYSMANNKEMGVLIERENEDDAKLYEDAKQEVDRIFKTSDDFEFSRSNLKPKEAAEAKSKTEKNQSIQHEVFTKKDKQNIQGSCIRCAASIKLNPMVPYCKDCYKIWNKYGDKEYIEKYCHICGIENETSMLKPTCYPCFKSNKNKLEFSN